jgi:hypothetical protein
LLKERYKFAVAATVRDGVAHRSKRLESRVKHVCGGCNQGWMSRLEEAAKPILMPMMFDNLPLVLSPSDQWTLARWAVKTALMVDLSYPPSDKLFSPSVFSQFFRRG